MATPEQNLLLTQGLFQQPAEAYENRNNQRLKVLMGIAETNRAEQLKRDLAEQLAQREDARYKSLADREDARVTGMETRQAATIAAAEKRQTAAQKEKERLDIENAFDEWYPKYAVAAARAGEPVKQREEYPTTRAGLGQLQADARTAEVGYVNKQLELSADSSISELEDKRGELTAVQKRLRELSKPSTDDEKLARSAAANAVKAGIEQGNFESTKKLSKKAISDGVAALNRGDRTVAQRLLGDEVLTAYEDTFSKTLFALPNVKSKMQEKAQVQQQLLAIQRDANRVDSDLRKASGTNPFLAEKLKTTRQSLRDLMSEPPPEAARPSAFEDFTPPAPPKAAPTTPTATPAVTSPQNTFGGILGLGESMAGATPALLGAPLQALDTMERYGTAGLRSLFSGPAGVPAPGSGPVAGRLRSLFSPPVPPRTTSPAITVPGY